MNAVVAFLPSDAPISAMLMAAFVLATLALVFLALAWRDHEPGLAWLSAGFGLAAVWYGFYAGRPYLVQAMDTPEERFWAAVLLLATLATSVGILDYLGATRRRERILAGLLAPAALVLAALAVGIAVPRLVVNLGLMTCWVGLSVLAFRQSTHEPGHGHVVLGASLLAIPGNFVALLALHAVPAHYRALGVMPLLFFGMTLLTVSLLRRRRALEAEIARRAVAEEALREANRTLEATVRARTQSLQELVSNLEAFNRSVSYDLRGPLGGIAGLARLASDAMSGGDTAMVQRSLDAISAQADTSAKLVGTLLQLAHVGDATLARRAVDLDALAHDVIAQLRLGTETSAQAPQAQWIVGALPEVQADADLLRPVLVNLFTNALKFSRNAAQPTVHVDASVDAAGEATVHVRDNGVGFDPAAAGRLFEPFMRLHGRHFEGHGIGLTIVRRAIERHGGRVWAESEPDQCAAFHFTLPRAA